jgi:hypothetical protein
MSTDRQEHTMRNLSLGRLAAVILAVDLVAFGVSGILRNADHGVGFVLGDIAWFGFLAGVLALLVVGVVALARAARNRSGAREPAATDH